MRCLVFLPAFAAMFVMDLEIDRYWLLTWTTYGTWLPGDERGFVSSVSEGKGPRKRHNQPLTPYDREMPGLERSAADSVKGQPVYLTQEHAVAVLVQLIETADFRAWQLLAAAVMRNHVHLVVGVPGDPDPASLLRDFKSYSSRRLNKIFGEPNAPRWWTESGSRRILKGDEAVQAAVFYVLNQEHPLFVWSPNTPDDAACGEDS
jgi:REP element-mobilizing transposase RayT